MKKIVLGFLFIYLVTFFSCSTAMIGSKKQFFRLDTMDQYIEMYRKELALTHRKKQLKTPSINNSLPIPPPPIFSGHLNLLFQTAGFYPHEIQNITTIFTTIKKHPDVAQHANTTAMDKLSIQTHRRLNCLQKYVSDWLQNKVKSVQCMALQEDLLDHLLLSGPLLEAITRLNLATSILTEKRTRLLHEKKTVGYLSNDCLSTLSIAKQSQKDIEYEIAQIATTRLIKGAEELDYCYKNLLI